MSSEHLKSDERLAFLNQYREAIEASGTPEMDQVRELVLSLFKNPDHEPEDDSYLPLVTFVRDALNNKSIPFNWVTAGPSLEIYEKRSKVRAFINELTEGDRIRIQDSDGDDIENLTLEKENALKAKLPQLIIDEVEEAGRTESMDEFFTEVEHVHVRIDDNNEMEIKLCPNMEVMSKMLASASLDLVRLFSNLNKTNGIYYRDKNGRAIEDLDTEDEMMYMLQLPPFVLLELRFKKITDVDEVDHIHVLIDDDGDVADVKVCRKREGISAKVRDGISRLVRDLLK